MKHLHIICTLLLGVAILLFFGVAYPHHLHYQEQYQLFLFDSTYVWDIVKHPGGIADLLGRFCTQFFLYAWVGAAIIALLLSLIQLLVWRLMRVDRLFGLSFVPSFLLWLYLLDEHALLSGVWAVLVTLLVGQVIRRTISSVTKTVLSIIVAISILYWLVGPVCFPLPIDGIWTGIHYYRYPTVFPWLLWAASLSVWVLSLLPCVCRKWVNAPSGYVWGLSTFLLVTIGMGSIVWKNSNLKAEKVMQYDFMATHQQWNRILETANAEKPNNQIGVTVQNLALAMRGMLLDHMFEYNQNGIAGLLPDVQTDATSPMPTAEAFYQLGMINVAQRTVFEAQESILDFQKSGRCYKRLAQTNLINGNYKVARKYLMALQKTLFYRTWANETLPLLGNEKAIAKHPEYGRLRQCAYKNDFYFGDHVTPEMLKDLYFSNKDNHMAYQYLVAYYLLTGDREGLNNFISMTR
ncbi:DUF6057 family protein [Prevotella sp. RM4]|uniref:DUF6057 family protein n=1 Tax=Prevotella sp. RM4 TaxID=1200547 RepID=UPI000ABC6A7F|nr:DUF6057 family protein [Prevotella sp. RM4]